MWSRLALVEIATVRNFPFFSLHHIVSVTRECNCSIQESALVVRVPQSAPEMAAMMAGTNSGQCPHVYSILRGRETIEDRAPICTESYLLNAGRMNLDLTPRCLSPALRLFVEVICEYHSPISLRNIEDPT